MLSTSDFPNQEGELQQLKWGMCVKITLTMQFWQEFSEITYSTTPSRSYIHVLSLTECVCEF